MLAFLLKECSEVKSYRQQLFQSEEKAKIWRDKYGRSNAELVVTKTDYNTFKNLHKDILDSIKSLKIQPRHIRSYHTITNTTTDTIYINKPYTDRWSSFNKINDSLISYTIKDSIALITHNKKYGFLNLKSKYVTRVVNFNPNSTITGITSTEIITKERRLSIGLQAGYGFVFSGSVKLGFYGGVGVGVRVF